MAACKSKNDKGDKMNPGDFTERKLTEPEVQAAFNFLRMQIKLKHADVEIKELVSARSQVVQGENFLLGCKYTQKSKDAKLNALVYRNLEGSHSITEVRLGQ